MRMNTATSDKIMSKTRASENLLRLYDQFSRSRAMLAHGQSVSGKDPFTLSPHNES